MTRNLLAAAVAALVFAPPVSSPLAAEPAPRPGAGAARGMGRGMPRNFDPATVTTVSGDVVAVHEFEGRRDEGLHVELKTADAVLDVHLGPAAYLRRQHLEVAVGDTLEVTGSKVELRGKPALIAQSVKKGETTATLRDAQGIPGWARRGR
jgi:hypothetical protein